MILWYLGLFFRFIDFMRFVHFLDVVGILYKHVRFFQFHQIALLCDHQELACTSKDPPRRVDMKEMSLICWGKNISWVIEKPFENLLLWHCLKTAYVLLYFYWMNHMNEIRTVKKLISQLSRRNDFLNRPDEMIFLTVPRHYLAPK